MTGSRRVVVAFGLAVALVVAACSRAKDDPAATATAESRRSDPPPSASPSPRPSPTAPAEPFTPAGPEVSDAPGASLVGGGESHPGEIGGFTFGGSSQSAPWLPATSLSTVEVAAGIPLAVELDERATIAEWAARVAPADDVTGDVVSGLAEGRGPVAAFAGPATGDWVLSVTITYGDGLGSGAYYWHVVAD